MRALLCLALILPSTAFGAAPAAFFEHEVRPLLAEKCFGCHTQTKMGGLEMTSRAALLKGGNRLIDMNVFSSDSQSQSFPRRQSGGPDKKLNVKSFFKLPQMLVILTKKSEGFFLTFKMNTPGRHARL